MGNAVSDNNSYIFQSTTNKTLQDIQNQCEYVCANDTSNVAVNIIDSDNATVDLSQTCSVVGTSCVTRTYLEADIENNLNAVASQTNKNDSNYLMFNYSTNNSTISQTIQNNISQMVSNFCKQDVNNKEENIYIYIKGSNNAKVRLGQSGNVSNAQCTFEVTSKISIINQESAKTDQKNINQGALADLIIILGLIFGIAIMFALIFMLKGGKKPGGDSSNACDQNPSACEMGIQQFMGK